jgi:hypothetical protein
MEIKASELIAKIKEIHPELEKNGVQVICYFEEKSGAWVVGLHFDGNSLETHLEQADVEDCLAGRQCVHLGVQVGRFVKNYCLRDNVCPT